MTDRALKEDHITFCILTFNRTPWLKRSLSSIRDFCETDFSVKILSQGPPDGELTDFLERLEDDRFQLITSRVNIGTAAGRNLLKRQVTSSLSMILDDDVYLTKGSVRVALDILHDNLDVGAVSMPLYDLSGHMVSAGGTRLIIRGGVMDREDLSRLKLDLSSRSWIEVDDICEGATLYRTELLNSFDWDEHIAFPLADEDKSLQILRAGRWKQVIATKGRMIHDRSWVGNNPNYERPAYDGLAFRRSYRRFRKKWGVRYNLRSHILYELVYPTIAITHLPLSVSQIVGWTRERKLVPF